MAEQNEKVDWNPDHEEEPDHSQCSAGNASVKNDEHLAIAKRETVVVNWFRLALSLVLAASAAGAGCGVFARINTSEQQEFEEPFHADAFKAFESIAKSLDVTIRAVGALVVSMVSFACCSNSSWPFVTLPGEPSIEKIDVCLVLKSCNI